MGLNEKQLEALKMVQEKQLSILCGAPGVGKTYTLKEIIKWTSSQKLSVAMAAPTGKAALQMQNATNFPATTIHKLLAPKFYNNQFTFDHNERNKLKFDFIILDETSMVTNNLMADILRAIDIKKTKLLLVGDFYQLPSIGPGKILQDLIESDKIPFVELTEIQRNSGDIVKACHQIKNKKIYIPSERLDPETGLNLRHIELKSLQKIQQAIQEIACNRMPAKGFDPLWDIQIISPTNQRTLLSCDSLNFLLQNELNKNEAIENTIFRTGDKVINTKNEKVSTPTGAKEMIINGDIGLIVNILPARNQIIIDFQNPSRTVAVPLRKNNLKLAYCITCHRFQGSEAPVIIIPVHSGFNFFVDQPWIYTAISRAQQICITVGEFSAIRNAIKKEQSTKRKTCLKEKLLAA